MFFYDFIKNYYAFELYLGVTEVIEGKEAAVGVTSPTIVKVVGGTARAGLDEDVAVKAVTEVATVSITAEAAEIVAVGRRVSAGPLRPSGKTWTRSWMRSQESRIHRKWRSLRWLPEITVNIALRSSSARWI